MSNMNFLFVPLKVCFMFLVVFVVVGLNTPLVVSVNQKKTEVVSVKHVKCLALNIYHEARGESHSGKVAVGYVVLNRVKNSAFPKNICKVVKEGGEIHNKCQFSWWCDGKSDYTKNKKSWRDSTEIAINLVLGTYTDPTQGALFYHSIEVSPYWAKKMTKTYHVGRHLFFKPS